MIRRSRLPASFLALLALSAPGLCAQATTAQSPPVAKQLPGFVIPNPGPWRNRTSMPTPRTSLAVGVINGEVFALGGEDILAQQVLGLVERYDATRDLWVTRAPLPTPRHALMASVVGGKLYAIGGATSVFAETGVVEEYDPLTDSWTSRAHLPTPRRRAAACAVSGKIYVLGGQSGRSPLPVMRLSSVEAYDVASDTWSSMSRMPLARAAAAATVLNGQIFLIGGEPDARRVDVYDPATDTWTSRAPMPTPRVAPAASTLGGQICVVGGRGPKGHALNQLEVYDPILDEWTSGAPMLTPREGLISAIVDSKLYVIGGQLVPGALAAGGTGEYSVLEDGTDCEQKVPKQLGTVSVVSTSCDSSSGPLPGTTCLTLSVECDQLPPLSVHLRITEPDSAAPLLGTVVLGTGGVGNEFYSASPGGEQVMKDLVACGFRTVERSWDAAWFTFGANLKAESCRYASLLTWIEANLHTTGSFCATGNSGGAAEIAYALTSWERADLLDLAVLSGGPPFTRLDLGCLTSQVPTWATVCGVTIPPNTMNCSPLACSFPANHRACDGCAQTPSLADLRSESVLHPAATLDYPNTHLDVLIGDRDCLSAGFSVLFFNAVTSSKTLAFVPEATHTVQHSGSGQSAIVQALLVGCGL